MEVTTSSTSFDKKLFETLRDNIKSAIEVNDMTINIPRSRSINNAMLNIIYEGK